MEKIGSDLYFFISVLGLSYSSAFCFCEQLLIIPFVVKLMHYRSPKIMSMKFQ